MARCNFCGATFGSRQGVRAHLKGCAAYHARDTVNQSKGNGPQGRPSIGKLPSRQQSEPKAMLSKYSEQQLTVPEPGSRLNAEAVEVVLRTYEIIRARREQLRDSLPIRRLSDPAARTNKWPTYEDWLNVGRDVARLELACERILQQSRVSRDEPWALYRVAITIRDRWVSWRKEEAYRCWQNQGQESQQDFEEVLVDFGVPDLEVDWSRIIDGLRWLTSHTRATLQLE